MSGLIKTSTHNNVSMKTQENSIYRYKAGKKSFNQKI